MAIKLKTVNIKANIPIRTVTPPIYGVRTGIKMTPSDILKCLCRRAIVEEVLSDGSTVRLTTKNFNNDFEAELQEKKKAQSEVKKPVYTGKIDEVDLLSDIDDDDDDNDGEPEEAANTIQIRSYIDGTTCEIVGIEPSVSEEEAEITHRFADGTVIVDNDEEEPTVEVEPDLPFETGTEVVENETVIVDSNDMSSTVTVNTTTDAANTKTVTRKNTSKNSTKKKKK